MRATTSSPSSPPARSGRLRLLPGAALGLAVAAVGLSACSSGGTTTAGSPSTSTSTAAAPGTTTRGAAGSTAPSAPAHRTVDANTASVSEIQAALEANGVPNAAKWAREVEEYRPYPTDDPSFASLKKNLAKYNPAPEVLQQILASLTL